MMRNFLLMMMLIPVCMVGFAQTVYVDADATGNSDGSSWQDAYTNLSQAIDAAESGNQIWVAAGVYYPTSQPNYEIGSSDPRFNHFTLKNGVTLYGGFAGDEASLDQRDPNANKSVLSGDIDQNDDIEGEGYVANHFKVNGENSLKLFYFPEGSTIDTTAVLDGFVLTGGVANKDVFPYMGGAAFQCSDASPKVVNCEFYGNYAMVDGGAIWINQSSMIIENCTFSGNYSEVHGGAVFFENTSASLNECTFTNNTSIYGGAVYIAGGEETSILENSVFENNNTLAGGNGGGISISNAKVFMKNTSFTNNMARSWGGGVVFHASCDVDMVNCKINSNYAGNWGGGIGTGVGSDDQRVKVRITNTRIQGNEAGQNYGGGIALSKNTDCKIYNSLISGNKIPLKATNYGGSAVTVEQNSSIEAYNCTFVSNNDDMADFRVVGTGSSADIYNSIIWDNAGDFYEESGVEVNVYNSRTHKYQSVNGNTNDNPLFLDNPNDFTPPAAGGNFALWGNSPVNNKGVNAYLPKDTYDLDNDGDVTEPIPYDLSGKERVFAGVVDMGCFEQQFESVSGNKLSLYDEQHVDMGDNLTLSGTDFTIETWIFPRSDAANGSHHNICGNNDNGTVNRPPTLYIFQYDRIHYGYGDGTNWNAGDTEKALKIGQWNHIAMTFNDATNQLTLYANGKLLETLTGVGEVPNTPLKYLNNDQELRAYIDEFRVWKEERTQQELIDNMNHTLSGNEENLALYYSFDQVSSDEIEDQAGLNNGTMLNRPGIFNSDAILTPVIQGVENVGIDNFTFSWHPVPNAMEYYIDVATDPEFKNLVLFGAPTGGATTYTVNGLSRGTVYYYKVTSRTHNDDWGRQTEHTATKLNPPGNAFVFDGSTYIDATDVTKYEFAGTTIETWVKVDADQLSSKWALWACNPSDFLNNYVLFYGTNGDMFSMSQYNYDAGSWVGDNFSGSALTADTWHHVAVVIDKDNNLGKLYLDGVDMGSFTPVAHPYPYGSYFSIGQEFDESGGNPAASDHIKGSMDEFRIWSKALSQSEIQNNMNNTLTGNEEGLVTYYNFDLQTGNKVIDNSNIFDGEVIGTADWIASTVTFTDFTVDASAQTTSGFTLNWDVISGASDYLVDIATDAQFSNTVVASTSTSGGNSYDATGLTEGTKYYFRVVSDQGDTSMVNYTNTVMAVPGNALVFDGKDDYIDITQITELGNKYDATMECWAYLDPTETHARFIAINTEDGGNKYILSYESATGYTVWNQKAGEHMVSHVHTKGAWVHLAVSFEGTRTRFYLNGELVSDVTGGNSPAIYPGNLISLGQEFDGSNTSDFLKGAIDEVRFWDKTLSQSEIKANMHRKLTGEEADLFAYYDFDQSEGQFLYETVNGLDGTIIGDPQWNASDAIITPLIASVDEITPSSFTFTWNALHGATDYKVEVATDAKFQNIVQDISSTSNDTSLQITGLTEGTDYYIRVASQTYRWSAWSATEKVSTLLIPPGNALAFDGIDGEVNVGQVMDSDWNQITLEAWAKIAPDQSANYPRIIGNYNPDGGFSMNLWRGTRQLYFEFRDAVDNSWDTIMAPSSLADNVWHHVACTYDGTYMKVYIDGQLVSVKHNPGAVVKQQAINTGIGNQNGAAPLNGTLDEIRIWNVARTQDELNEYAHKTLTGSESGLVSYFNLDKAEGNTFRDGAGNSDGTMTGGVTWAESKALITPFTTGAADILNNDFTATWKSVPNASKYYLRVAKDPLLTEAVEGWESVDVGNDTAYSIAGLKENTIYYYGVMSETDRLSAWSAASKSVKTSGGTTGELALHIPENNARLEITDYLGKFAGKNTGAITGWFKTETNGDLFLLSDGTYNNYMRLRIGSESSSYPDESLAFILTRDGSQHLFMTIRKGRNYYTDGQWHHFAVITGDGNNRILVDGKPQEIYFHTGSAQTQEFTNITNPNRLWIGNNFTGSIDEIAFYKNPITNNEVIERAHRKLTGDEIGLVAYYSFDQSNANDISGNGRDASETGSLSYAGANVLSAPFLNDPLPGVTVADLSWAAIDSAGQYKVEVATDARFQNKLVDNAITTSASYHIEGLDKNTKYFYRVKSKVDTVWSEFSGTGEFFALPGKSLLLDGVDDYVTANSITTESSQEATIECWVKLDADAGSSESGEADRNVIWSINTSTGGNHYVLVYHPHMEMLSLWGAGLDINNIKLGTKWHHIAVSLRNNEESYIYIDGKQIASFTLSQNAIETGCQFSIGQEWDGSTASDFYKGEMDEFRVWDIALTEPQIRANMNLSEPEGANEHYIAHFTFDELHMATSSETLIKDKALQNDGTLVGGAAIKNSEGVILPITLEADNPTLGAFDMHINDIASAENFEIEVAYDETFVPPLAVHDNIGRNLDYTVNELCPGVTYYFRARAIYDENTISAWSTPDTITTIDEDAAIQNFTATEGDYSQNLKLSWECTNDYLVSEFEIKRRIACEGEFKHLVTVPNSDALYQYTDTLAEPGTYYEYTIQGLSYCYGNDTEIDTSNIGFNIPALVASKEINDETMEAYIRLDWQYHPDFCNNVELVRTNTESGIANVFQEVADSLVYRDGQVELCVPYNYQLVAKTSDYDDVKSHPVIFTLEEDIFDAIDTLDASKGYMDSKITLNWESRKQNIIDEYQISRRVYCSGNEWEVVKVIDRGTTQVWIDEDASPGIYYEYCIVGIGTCSDNMLYTDSVSSVGYRQPEGIISGLVTYQGGNPVANVKVVAEYANADETLGSCLYFDGADTMMLREGKTFDFSSGFTFEMWVRPVDMNNSFTIFENTDSVPVTLKYNAATTTFDATVDGTTSSYDVSGGLWDDGEWNHIAMKADGANLSLLINGELANTVSCVTLPVVSGLSTMGLNYNGYMDELRIWNEALTDSLINRNHNLVLEREIDGLAAALRFDVNKGTYAFDHSRTNDVANEAHGFIYGAEWAKDNIPSTAKLALAAMTEPAGSYMLKGVWFSGTGDNYAVTPVFGVHAFEPATRNLLVSENSLVFSNQDYTDISSFLITGNVKYKNTTFPVTGVNILIDGDKVYDLENNPIQTGDDGNFSIEVPIGDHVLSAQKEGHMFAEGFFPPKVDGEIALHNFQDDITGIQFIDSTTRIIAGRVVGGAEEGDKKIGFGKSVNNIGQYTIDIKAEREEFGYTKSVTTNDSTGEYELEVIPERFIVESVAGNPAYMFDLSMEGPIDLTSVNDFKVEKDTLIAENNGVTDTTVVEYPYHFKKNWIYRTPMSINVTKENGNPVLSDSILNLESGDIPIYSVDADGNVMYNYGQPIFAESNMRTFKVIVTEEYTNYQTGETFVAPVTDANVIIKNNLAIDDSQKSLSVNSKGVATYTFRKGEPNLAADELNPGNSFTKTMEVKAERNAESVDWLPNGEVFRGINLGFQVTGTNFVTQGPDRVDFVLRDPPGSNSSSFVEEGFTIERTETKSRNRGFDASLGVFVMAGPVTAGPTFNHESTWTTNNTSTESVTFNTRYSTSDDPAYVGAMGDVFFGRSTNITYGLCKQLSILPTDSVNPDLPSAGGSYNGHKLGQMYNFAMGDEVATTFVFTQNHIENYLIPDLMKLRNNFFSTNPSVYSLVDEAATEKLVPESGYYAYNGGHDVDSVELYQAMINAWVMELAINEFQKLVADGDARKSYNWGFTYLDFELGSIKVTEFPGYQKVAFTIGEGNAKVNASIRREYNRNEDFFNKNISFDAGAIYESSMTTSQETSVERTYEFQTSIGFKSEVESPGVSIPFVGRTPGFKIEASANYNFGGSSSDSKTETKERTVGYTLSDGDQGDFFSVDIAKDAYGNGPIFITRGGQSACPYEGLTETKYVMPGTPIGSATMRIEVPTLQVDQSMISNVPETNPAVFTLKLGNQSEVEADAWFMLSVDVASNPHGAKIKMDGASINNGTAIMIPGGKQITKTIELYKGQADINEYDDIRLVLASMCQYDPTDDIDDIFEDITLSAHFVPTCTPVTITAPKDNWLLNVSNNDTLPVRISGYDTQLSTFDKLALQYKPKAESNWVTMYNYFNNQTAYDEHVGDDKELIDNRSFVLYDWDMKNQLDRQYEIRVVSVCSDNSMYESEPVLGLADTKRPQLFGTPQPADGILSANDEIKIVFDEAVEEGLITDYNFEVKGVLNGADLHHGTSVFFDGTEDYVRIPKGLPLDGRSFTVEFWLKKAPDATGTVLSLGNGTNNTFAIGFDADNIHVNNNGDVASAANIMDDGSWHHWAAVYNKAGETMTVYVDDQVVMEKTMKPVTADGRLYLGKDVVNDSDEFTGYMHDLRIWSRAVSYSSIIQNMSVKLTGTEAALAGYWPMNEAHGSVIDDEARSRHGELYATWDIHPKSQGYELDGATQALAFSTATIPMHGEMDMTFELWFKGDASAAGSTLFSNGNTEAEGAEPASIWNINLTTAGEVEVWNNDVSVVSNESYTDDQWHHVAFVLNRRGYGTLLVDGEKVASTNAAQFGNFQSAYAYVGARGYVNNSGVNTFDKYFAGAVDEIRIWNLARTQEQIKMHMNAKLENGVTGLKAYFPFETYAESMGVMMSSPSLEDMSVDPYSELGENNCGTLLVLGEQSISETSPNIKRAPAKQNVDFDFAVNENAIIITPNASLAKIERCILEITAMGIQDKNANAMASPVTWTAYIDKNEVRWDNELFEFEKETGVMLSFENKVINLGGLPQEFSITNIPDWMTVVPTNGTLEPNSELMIDFTIEQDMAIGEYEKDIHLESASGYAEKLMLNLDVYKQAPDWTVDVSQYEYSMNIAGQLKIKEVFSTDTDDRIAVFAGDECRGVAILEYKESYDDYIAYLVVYGNTMGEELTYKIWDASEGTVYSDVVPVYNFEPNKFYGSMREPVVFEAGGKIDTEILLTGGWNWISFNLEMDDASVNTMFADVNHSEGDVIKHAAKFATYDLISQKWFGSMDNLEVGKLYRVKLGEESQFRYVGIPVNPENHPIELVNGWNRIGYLPSQNLPVNEALASFQPEVDDIIKGQFQFAIWDGYDWLGSLSYMKPGEGYMYLSNGADTKTFTYPNAANRLKKASSVNASLENLFDAHAYEHSMNIVAEVLGADIPENAMIGAYINGELRGVASLNQGSGTNRYSFITVHANNSEDGASINFKLVSDEDSRAFNESTVYEHNKVEGTVAMPFMLTLENGMMDQSISHMEVYPNPFHEEFSLEIFAHEDGKLEVELYNMVGEKVAVLYDSQIEKGLQKITFNLMEQRAENIQQGIYVMKVISQGKTYTQNIIKLK